MGCNSSKQIKRSGRVKSAQFNNKDLSEEFGVPVTETLQHFAKPKPPRNPRRPRNTTKVAPLLSDLQEEPENHENDLEINRQDVYYLLTYLFLDKNYIPIYVLSFLFFHKKQCCA